MVNITPQFSHSRKSGNPCRYRRNRPDVFAGLIDPMFLLLPALLCLLTFACGKKAPPVPPQALPLPAVSALNHKVDDANRLILAWSAPRGTGAESLGGYAVMRAVTRLDQEECTGCPILFKRVKTLGPSETEYRETLTPGRYIYKVVAFTTYNTLSPDSDLIRLTVSDSAGDS